MTDNTAQKSRATWVRRLKGAVAAGDPRRVWDLYMQIGGQAADLAVRGASWTNNQLTDAATTAIKSIARAKAARREYDAVRESLSPQARAQFDGSLQGQIQPTLDRFSSYADALEGMTRRIRGNSARLDRQMDALLVEIRTFTDDHRVFGAAPAVAAPVVAAPAAGATITAGGIALVLAGLAALAFGIYLIINASTDAIHKYQRSQAFADIDADPALTQTEKDRAKARWDRDNPPPSQGEASRFMEAVGKALPWAAALAGLGLGTKVYLDFRAAR